MRGEDPGLATFWHGPLNPFAYGCLASFARKNAPVVVYSYDLSLDVPAGVRLEDARRIVPDESFVGRYLVDGKPSIATFADMFRYRLIAESGRCWIDADFLCLSAPDLDGEDCVFARQADAVSETLVNNAVLRLPSDHPALHELNAIAEAAIDKDQRWGALGPFLLTPVLQRHGLYFRARRPKTFYPVEPEQFWKLFLPAWRERIEARLDGAILLHLWSEAMRWSGWDFFASPPPGSYLHEFFAGLGVLERFSRVADEGEARRVYARRIGEAPA